jgi:hypothetical protein
VSNLQLSICSGCYFIANLAKIDQTRFLSLFWLIPSHILRLNWPIPTHFLLAGCIVSLFPISAPSTPFLSSQKKNTEVSHILFTVVAIFLADTVIGRKHPPSRRLNPTSEGDYLTPHLFKNSASKKPKIDFPLMHTQYF